MAIGRSDRTRHLPFLPKAVSGRFEALTSAPGTSKSRILAEALPVWLERKGADELELRFARRLYEAARSVGSDRFAALVQHVGQLLASARLSLLPEEPR